MSKLSKIFFSVILIALFVFSSFAVNVQGLSVSYNYLTINSAYDPMTISANITLTKKPYCIITNDETNRVYVGVDNGLIVIHGDTNQVMAEITLSNRVEALAVNPLTNRIYAGISGGNIAVIDGATNLKVGEIGVTIGTSYEIAVNPVTNRVYIMESSPYVGGYDAVGVRNGETLQLITSVPLGVTAYVELIGIAVNPNTNKVYATWTGNNSLFMIDGNTNLVTKSVVLSSFRSRVMVNSYTGYVYSNTSVLNGETLAKVTPGQTNEVVAIDPVHNFLYIVDYSDNLYRINGSTHAVVDSLKLQWDFIPGWDSVAVNSKTSKVYVVHNLMNQPIEVIPEFPLLIPVLLAVFALTTTMIAFKRRMFRINAALAPKTI